MKIGNQSIKFNDIFINETATIVGPVEGQGPISSYFDEIVEDNYLDCDSFEKAEILLQIKSIKKLFEKTKMTTNDIDLLISGDLINQTAVSNYAGRNFNIPFWGVYGACSTSILNLIIASNVIESGNFNNIICVTSSHNLSAERQFRSPIEYGGAKNETTTFTVTGGCAALVSNTKSKIKIEGATIGKVIDVGFKDATDMGRAMAPAAVETLLSHFEDFNCKPSDYDLILTGDLSSFGFEIVNNLLKERYQKDFNYNDCGLIIYDKENQNVFSGGSGCACCGCVTYAYVKEKLLSKELNKVLICATGALMNTNMSLQKESVPAIAHAIILSRCDE